MVEKETRILLPMCLEFFSEEEWAEIAADSPEYGWCLVVPEVAWRPEQPAGGPDPVAMSREEGVDLASGVLNAQQLTAIFRHLPVDITFVDAEDRVRYFSETPDRVFARSRTIIGRKVHHCHPPSSVDIVERILDDFRSGRQDHAAFWIPFQDKFVHIQYVAVHHEDGTYLGCLEATQDIAPLRQLEGERRLLQYD
ncbi:MAG: PAS domain-containing protein [Planctomycetota bacterium]